MKEQIIQGIMSNLWIVGFSFILMVAGTFQAYNKFGLKRVLLGKKNEHRELVYKRGDNSVDWKPTLKTWGIILTGGMNLLSLFLIAVLLVLSLIYQHDIQATKENDAKLCGLFGTTSPTEEQLIQFNNPSGVIEVNYEREIG